MQYSARMSLGLIAILVLVILTVGYLLYGGFLARQYRINDAEPTPAARINDGVDFIPTRPFYLLGQHFSAIAAAGPIVGPIVACIAFGWLPCLLWIVIGVVLIGAVHDFSALIASVRHGAHSIADVAREHLGTRAYLALVAFIWLALVYVIVAFTDVTAGTFLGKSEELEGLVGSVAFNPGGAVAAASVMYLLLAAIMGVVQRKFSPPMWLVTLIFVPATLGVIALGTQISHWTVFARPESCLGLAESARPMVWYSAILVYCFAASVMPMWLLQQPRGYLGGFVLYLAIAVGVVGVLFGGFDIKQDAMRPVADYGVFFGVTSPSAGDATAPPMTALVFPFLFVTIACGACSGFHGLVCGGTTSRQVAKESHCKSVAFGAMLLEGFVAVIALATVMILTKQDLAKYAGRPGAIYGDGLAVFITRTFGITSQDGIRLAQTFGQMAVATFVFDTLDVSTRLGRYLIVEFIATTRGRRASACAAHAPKQASAPQRPALPSGLGVLAAALTAFIPLFILFTASKGSYLLFWTLFGTSNQLLAALTLLGITVWLKRQNKGRKVWFVAVPMVFVMTITLCALAIQIFVGIRDATRGMLFITAANAPSGLGGLNPTVLNAGVATALLALAMFFVFEALRSRPATLPTLSKP